MKRRAWGRVQGLGVFVLLMVIRGCSQPAIPRLRAAGEPDSVLRDELRAGEMRRQYECADQLVTRLADRDGLSPFIESRKVQVEPRYRIRVFFQFRQDMRKILPKLGRFWKFPRWIGGGRYASSYGQGQPGFELHPDPEEPSRTVGLNARKSSDVDQHEPAGDAKSIVLHAVNVVQHKFGKPEAAPCDLLALLPKPERPATLTSQTRNAGR